MSSYTFRERANQAAMAGKTAYERGEVEEAYRNYLMASRFMHEASKYEKSPQLKQAYKDMTLRYIEYTERLKEEFESSRDRRQAVPSGMPAGKTDRRRGGPKSGGQSGGGDGDGDEDDEEVDEDTQRLRQAIASAIVTEKPNVKWEDVAGLENAKAALQEAVILPMKFPQLFQERGVEPWRGILLYGPPGTGKSYIAKAVATEADATFFSVTASDLVSKWQGESEKLVRALFELADQQKPSIIFFDEIDALGGARGGAGESESSRRVKNELLVRMQGMNSSEGILVLGATNLPWQIDSALRRRFQQRIYIPLPDIAARTAMFRIHTKKTPTELADTDYRRLAEETEGYSGSDLSLVVKNALFQPIRRCTSATHFKEVENGMLTPCSPSDPGAQAMRLMDIPPEKLKSPSVGLRDFILAVQSTPVSVGAGECDRYDEWTEEFGTTA